MKQHATPTTVMMPSACPKCRSRLAVVRPVHLLTCTTCRRQRGSLSKQEADFIDAIISTFGLPARAPPPCRGSERA